MTCCGRYHEETACSSDRRPFIKNYYRTSGSIIPKPFSVKAPDKYSEKTNHLVSGQTIHYQLSSLYYFPKFFMKLAQHCLLMMKYYNENGFPREDQKRIKKITESQNGLG